MKLAAFLLLALAACRHSPASRCTTALCRDAEAVGCGLIALRNELTRWCIRHGCDYDEHPGYAMAVKELTT